MYFSFSDTDNDRYVIEIIDNGVGISPKRLDEIKLALAGRGSISRQSMSSGIGLANVSERLRAYYGSKYQMLIESMEKVGTSVKIIIEL